jgi:putative transposase
MLPAGFVYHVGNRGSRKGPLFDGAESLLAFERLVDRARGLFPVRLLAYCLMRNHWHFLLWPIEDDAISRFMHWLTGTHARHRRHETKTDGEGALYQARFWADPIFDELHLTAAWRYIERNPVEAGLVERAEYWRWSSAYPLEKDPDRLSMDFGPFQRPGNWLEIVNGEAEQLLDTF